MEHSDLVKKLAGLKVIPVIAIDEQDRALPLADTLIKGGLPVAEITFRTHAAADVLTTLRKARPKMLLGAGTVLSVEHLEKAVDCGAAFAVAPGLNQKVVEAAQKMNFPFFPGVMTPSDVDAAIKMGCSILKFFPAEAAGGVKLLKSLEAPYHHLGIQFIPTGGITLANMSDYLSVASVLAVGGTWIAKKEDICRGDWSSISSRCRESVKRIKSQLEKR
ncbi:MAG: bifunctional 4-hydroxy-2-oxoglutarate aldolase/2-dehydro-3-deoxy-phosphogluconate aldolase [bacterium]